MYVLSSCRDFLLTFLHEGAYPPPDRKIRDILTRPPKGDVKNTYYLFFEVLADEVLECLAAEDYLAKDVEKLTLPERWQAFLERKASNSERTNRDKLYEKVADKMKEKEAKVSGASDRMLWSY